MLLTRSGLSGSGWQPAKVGLQGFLTVFGGIASKFFHRSSYGPNGKANGFVGEFSLL